MAEDIFNIKIKAQDAYSSALKRMESNYAKAAIAITGSIATISAGLFAITTETAKVGDEFLKWSKTTGVAVKSLSELSYVTRVLGGDQEKLYDILKETAVRMKEAQDGTGPLRDNLKHLGIEFQNVDGTLRDTETVFFEIVNSLNQLENQALKVAIADEIWSDAGTELLNVLGQNKDEINALRQEARDLGLTFDNEAAEASREFNKELTRLKANASGLTTEIGQFLTPALTALFKLSNELIKSRPKIGGGIEAETRSRQDLVRYIHLEQQGVNALLAEKENALRLGSVRNIQIDVEIARRQGVIRRLQEQLEAVNKLEEAQSKQPQDQTSGLSGRLKLEEDLARQIQQINFDIDQELLSAQYQAEAVAYEARQQAINDEIAQYNDKFEQEWDMIVAQNERIARAGLTRYEYEEYLRRKDLADTKRNERLKLIALNQGASLTVGILENLNTLAGDAHRDYFNVLKIARISEAIINTATGATRALSDYPAPYSYAVAALTVAKGLTEVAIIQSQSFGGGGSSGGGSSIGSGGSFSGSQQASSSQIPQAPTSTTDQQSNVGLTVIIQNPLGTEDWDRIVEEDIAPAIRRATDRNITITS